MTHDAELSEDPHLDKALAIQLYARLDRWAYEMDRSAKAMREMGASEASLGNEQLARDIRAALPFVAQSRPRPSMDREPHETRLQVLGRIAQAYEVDQDDDHAFDRALDAAFDAGRRSALAKAGAILGASQ